MLKRALMAMALVACSAQSGADGQFQEGVHFETISPAVSPGKERVEVVEVFSYSCVHCATFDPYVEKWAHELPENVEFKRVPAVFNPSWEPFARAYYTAEVLGVLDETHEPLFQALHTERQPLRSLQDLAGFYAQHGVDEAEFMKTAQSFAVETKLRRSKTLVPRYGVGATPTMIVNGRYRATGSQAGGFEELLAVVDDLVAREQAAMGDAQAAADTLDPATPES